MTIYMSAALAQAMGMILLHNYPLPKGAFLVIDQWGRHWAWPFSQGVFSGVTR